MSDRRKFIPYNAGLKEKARENRRNRNSAEIKIWNEVLRGKGFKGLKFTRQKPIGPFIVDFYCAELMLAIEIDGDSHQEKLQYDNERTEKLKQIGVTVIRYLNDDVLHHLQGVYEDLELRVEEMMARHPDQ